MPAEYLHTLSSSTGNVAQTPILVRLGDVVRDNEGTAHIVVGLLDGYVVGRVAGSTKLVWLASCNMLQRTLNE